MINPDCNDVYCHLSTTATLAEMLIEKCLRPNREAISNKEVLLILASDNFNNGVTGMAYEFVRCYGQITDCVRILEDRSKQKP